MIPNVKLIESPNQSLRKRVKIDMIIIHATGGPTLDGAVTWMCNPKSGVSAHYCIDKNGDCVQLVKESKKSWHAGKSNWEGQDNLNENSIGIELVNLNDGHDSYPDEQLIALAELIADIQRYYQDITEDRILGHDQIAPGRKTDPNINFPWVKFGGLLQYHKTKKVLNE